MVLTFDLLTFKAKPVTRDSASHVNFFDPSYFVDINGHRYREDVTLSPDTARQCKLEIIGFNPTPEQTRAARCSRTADADPDNR
ncbi:DUF1007 family protein [Vibrio chagasii]|nr:DUF1007 family protein [Vibrio chagasii]